MSQWETQAWSSGPRFPCPSTLQAQAAFLHSAQLLVITSATCHRHPAQGSSGQRLSPWPLGSQKHPRTAAAASQMGSRIVPAYHTVAQCCGGG